MLVPVFIVLFLARRCHCGGDKIALNLERNAERSKFIEIKKDYKGIPYLAIFPKPGYEVICIKNGRHIVQEFHLTPVKFHYALVHYNERARNMPLFIIKTVFVDREPYPKGDYSPYDEDQIACVKTLMTFVKFFCRENVQYRETLSDLELQKPPDRSLSKIIYKVFKGEKYLGGCDKLGFCTIAEEGRETREAQGAGQAAGGQAAAKPTPMETEETPSTSAQASARQDQEEPMDTS